VCVCSIISVHYIIAPLSIALLYSC